MCGRAAVLQTASELQSLTGASSALSSSSCDELRLPRYNLSPGQPAPILLFRSQHMEIHAMIWGLMPTFAAPNQQMGHVLINARTETVAKKPAFRSLVDRKRCILLVSGFFEWKAENDHSSKGKQGYFVQLDPQQNTTNNCMYLAALWDARKPKDSLSSSKSEEIRTFTVLTTESCEQISWLHDRMPLILTKEQAEKWLDCDKYSFKECESFIHSYKGKLIWHAVSQKVNSVKNDDPECVLPLDEVKEKQKASGIGKFFSKSQNVDSSSEHVFEKNVSTPKKEVKLCQDSKSAGKLRTSSSTQAAKRQRSITQFFKTK